MIMPKIKPLPSFIEKEDEDRKEKEKQGKKILKAKENEERKKCSDEEFLKNFEGGNLPSWSHKQYCRACFTYLRLFGRQKGLKQWFEGIEQREGKAYHLTIAYFWAQIIDFSREKSDQTFEMFWKRVN